MIEISDTGTGMPPEVVSRIFEPFFTTKEQGKGTGLGLSMVFGFIKQSGGHINVYSEPGHGTTFRLYLPLAAVETAGAGEPDVAPAIATRHETVLVVEDNPGLRRIAVKQLRDLGYDVIEADNALAALAMLEGGKVALVFSDVVMPGRVDGFELASEICKRWPAVRVVLTSGFSGAHLRDNLALLEPTVRLLPKPYRKAELAAVMEAALGPTVGPSKDEVPLSV
jgi:two-component system, cell cycle sensor histidine kinase and response regulator CckA